MSGLSEDQRRAVRRFDIRTAFTTVFGVEEVDPPLIKASVVDKVPCSCGKEYIDQTKRALETHIKEHQSATRGGKEKNVPKQNIPGLNMFLYRIKHQPKNRLKVWISYKSSRHSAS